MSDFSSHLHWAAKKKMHERVFSGMNGCVADVWRMLHVVQTTELIRACLMQIWKEKKISGRKAIVFGQ